MELHHADLAKLPIANGVVDVAMARSVMEHVTDPLAVYTELHRVLKPGGHFIFLTPNLWDYASLIAKLVPNRLHPWIVARTEGREEQDVFPTAYRTNTRSAILAWATKTGFRVADLRYLSQYPSYFMFNGALFMLAMGYERLTSRLECLDFLRGWILATLQKQ
jgi:SAM-dependent methyltransferase